MGWLVARERKVHSMQSRSALRSRRKMFVALVQHSRHVMAMDHCSKQIVRSQRLQNAWVAKAHYFSAWLGCVIPLNQSRRYSKRIVEELAMYSRQRDLARQKFKMSEVDSAFARLESARALDTLILSLQSTRASPVLFGQEGDVDGGSSNSIVRNVQTNLQGSDLFRQGKAASDTRKQISEDNSCAGPSGVVLGLGQVEKVLGKMRSEGRPLDFESLMALSKTVATETQ